MLLYSLLLFVAPSVHQRKEEHDENHDSQNRNNAKAVYHEEWDKLVSLEATMTAKQINDTISTNGDLGAKFQFPQEYGKDSDSDLFSQFRESNSSVLVSDSCVSDVQF